MPDYFVPVDTTLYTDYHRNLVAKGVVIKTTMNFIEKNRKALLDKYKTFEKFNEKFEIDDQLLNYLREAADKEKIEFNEEQYNKALPLIKAQLKALIARDLWDMNEYFQVMNATNRPLSQLLLLHPTGNVLLHSFLRIPQNMPRKQMELSHTI